MSDTRRIGDVLHGQLRIVEDVDRLLRISSGEWPGKMRQFAFACADSGSAYWRTPAFSRVATQVVRKFELNSAPLALRRAAAAMSAQTIALRQQCSQRANPTAEERP